MDDLDKLVNDIAIANSMIQDLETTGIELKKWYDEVFIGKWNGTFHYLRENKKDRKFLLNMNSRKKIINRLIDVYSNTRDIQHDNRRCSISQDYKICNIVANNEVKNYILNHSISKVFTKIEAYQENDLYYIYFMIGGKE